MEYCNDCKIYLKKHYLLKHKMTKKHNNNILKNNQVITHSKKINKLKVCDNNTISSILNKYLCNDVVNVIFSFIGENKITNKLCYHNCNGNLYLNKCCSCLDKRPYDDIYLGYKDGIGMIPVERNKFYCQDCRLRTINTS